jgi:hypothetical protein
MSLMRTLYLLYTTILITVFLLRCWAALQRTNSENLKQIFPEKELRGHSPYFQILESVSNLYIPMIDLPILLQDICGLILGIYKALTGT